MSRLQRRTFAAEGPEGGAGPQGRRDDDPGRGQPSAEPPRKSNQWLYVLLWILIVGGLIIPIAVLGGTSTKTTVSYPYSTFIDKITAGQVAAVSVSSNGELHGTLKSGQDFTSAAPVALGTPDLTSLLQAEGVTVTATPPGGTSFLTVVATLAPMLLILVVVIWFFRRARQQQPGTGGMGNVGRSKAKVIDAQRPSTTFGDVAGYEGVKQEISEVVDYLRNPERYQRVGAVGPKGVLMVGPPGTGKTLLARAVAGEAEVPFLSVAGSSFVEMFVGVGAARVRDLFAEARKRAPSIVFVDEIDAIGSRRGNQLASNEERDQTLNQLLAEMDGFDRATGVVVLAATNRPDVLDAALLRPGRFDRQVVVPLPTQVERRAILQVHARGKPIADDVDLDMVSRATPGFSGADLANLMNEAAIFALRSGREVVTAEDFDAARDRILLGRRDASNALLPEEKVAVAVHEAGHTLVAALSPHSDPVAKVTILPAGQALGVTEQLPLAERHLYSESYLRESLAVRLGGRAAELIVFGEGSTGAANDLSSATELATKMVREFGLSGAIGPVGYGVPGESWSGGDDLRGHRYAEATQRRIDGEVRRLLAEAEKQAVAMLTMHRSALDRLTDLLIERETIDGDDVQQVLREELQRATGAVVSPGAALPVPAASAQLAAAPAAKPGPERATAGSVGPLGGPDGPPADPAPPDSVTGPPSATARADTAAPPDALPTTATRPTTPPDAEPDPAMITAPARSPSSWDRPRNTAAGQGDPDAG